MWRNYGWKVRDSDLLMSVFDRLKSVCLLYVFGCKMLKLLFILALFNMFGWACDGLDWRMRGMVDAANMPGGFFIVWVLVSGQVKLEK